MKIINPNIWRKFRLPLILTFVLSSLLIAGVSFAASNDHLKNAARGQCLQANTDTSIAARNCITNEPKQTWVYNSVNQLVNANGKCLTATARNVSVTLSACRINNARAWVYDSTQHFKNTNTGQCLTVNNGALNGVAKVSNCINTSASQQWQFTTIAPPAANWLQHDIKLNGI